MMTRIKRLILRYLIRDILRAITIEDLLRVEKGVVFIGNRQLDQEELTNLKSEAKSFERSLLWKLMLNNLYWIANFKMIRGTDRERDMDNGKKITFYI